MRQINEKQPVLPLRVRCTHCRTVLSHDPQNRRACHECGSQMAMHNGVPIMIARNASDGVPLHKLDPKKRRVLIPQNS